MNRVYALLVGVNDYPDRSMRLQGCLNDIDGIAEYLNIRAGGRLSTMLLKDKHASRNAVIELFTTHLGQARSGDVALFVFSGHGSQQPALEEFRPYDPDYLDETLVCHDSRLTGQWDLADKEMAALIRTVAKEGVHVVIMLDCCHSGSGTRVIPGVTRARRAPSDHQRRPRESYWGLPAPTPQSSTRSGWRFPGGRHILMAACRDNELAKESQFGTGQHGAFTYHLVKTLAESRGHLTYRDLFRRTAAQVLSAFSDQTPQLEATDPADLDSPFLAGFTRIRRSYFTVRHDNARGWLLEAGRVHGIQAPAGGESTSLGLLDFDAPEPDLDNLAGVRRTAHVTEVFPDVSRIELDDKLDVDPSTTWKAVIRSVPEPPFLVRLSGDRAAVDAVRTAIASAAPGGRPSIYVRTALPGVRPDCLLVAEEREYRILSPLDSRMLCASILSDTAESARVAVQRLEHIARWNQVRELRNTDFHGDKRVELQIFHKGKLLEDTELELTYAHPDAPPPVLSVKIRNSGTLSYYCAVLALSESYAIDLLVDGGGIWLKPEAEVLLQEELNVVVPDPIWEQGVTQRRDLLKLIAARSEFDATLLAQTALDHAESGTREIQRAPAKHAGWHTAEVVITAIRPRPATPIPASGAPLQLLRGLQIDPHPDLKAEAKLSTIPLASRDMNGIILPDLLAGTGASEPFAFVTGRGSSPDLSVLELTAVDDHTAVTREKPLRLQISASLLPGEHILAIAWDGEFFLPVGSSKRHNGTASIEIERLAAPTSAGRKTLTGAIRIFFRKVLSRAAGIANEYPILAAARLETEKVVYEKDRARIASLVNTHDVITLYIHGIIGDTRGMVESSAACGIQGLLLSFDYENLNTPIEHTARALKLRLAGIGLGAGHSKALRIVAHSMGGLVARWFVEREGGDQIVDRLVMLGTPNAGSPWPTIHDWATTALALGLNALTVLAWPVWAVGLLAAAMESIDVTLDQMRPHSAFLSNLGASPDPAIPYVVIAGNTSLIPSTVNGQAGTLARLLQALSPRRPIDAVVAAAFFHQPNDIAVSVDSMAGLPPERSNPVKTAVVACDHMTYFDAQESRLQISHALGDRRKDAAQCQPTGDA